MPLTQQPAIRRDENIQSEQVRLLYRGLTVSIVATLVNAAALTFILWPVVSRQLLLGWVAVALLVAAGRALLTAAYARQHGPVDSRLWIRRSGFGTLAAALAWGSAGVLLFVPDNPTYQLFLALILAGVAAGSISSLAPVWSCVATFLTVSLAPLTVMFLATGSRLGLTVGALAVLFYLVLISGARRIYLNIQDNIALRVDSEPRERLLQQNVAALESLHAITSDDSLSLDEKLRQLLQLGVRTYGLTTGIVSHIEGERYTVLYSASPDGNPVPGTEFELGDTYCSHTLKSGAPVAIHHTATSSISGHPCYRKFGLEAYIGCPLFVNGERYGTLNFSSSAARTQPFSQQEISLLQLLAQWIGNELTRRIITSERDAFFNVSLDLLCIAGTDGYFKQLNPAWQQALGYSDAELKAKPFVEFVHPEDREATSVEASKLAGGRDTVAFENRYRHRDGSYRWFTWTATADPRSGMLYAVARDITHQKEADAQLARQANEAILMQRGMVIANETATFDEALQQCVDLVCDTLKWPVGHAFLPGRAPRPALHSAGIWHIDDTDRYAEFRNLSQQLEFGADIGLPGRIWANQQAHWIQDVSQDPYLPRAAVCAKTGLHSAMGFPILVGNEVEAVLEFFHNRVIESDPELLRSLTALGLQIGRVLERRRANEAIAESEARNRLLLESAGDGIYGLDAYGRTTFVNTAAAQMLGYTSDELVGQMMHSTVHHSHPDGSPYLVDDCPMYRAIREGSVQRITGEVLWRKDGSSFPIEYTSTPIRQHGDVVGAVVTFRDITERRKVDRIKNEFISTVSHELRTPLTSIRGSLGLLAGGAVGEIPDKAKSLVEIACNNSERLVRLVNDILDIEKIESGNMRFDMRPLQLNRLLNQTIATNQGFASEFDVQLNTRFGDDMLVLADQDRLIQVMTNLLSNAIKFSPRGGKVTVSTMQMADKVRVAVTDQGPGIPEEFQSRLFDKFSQAEATDSRRSGGTGLGLSISRAIIRKFGGEIDFTTGEHGTTMFFELPVYHKLLPEAQSPGLDTAAVLVCEDDPDVGRLLRMILEKAGHSTELAPDAETALAMLGKKDYAAMTLDLVLPGMSGVELIHHLRRDPGTRNLPVIVVSARARDGQIEVNGMGLSVVDWLEKPIDTDRLLEAVQRATNRLACGRPRILHVEDDPDVLQVVRGLFNERADFVAAMTLDAARTAIAECDVDVIILDIAMPDGSGLELLPLLSDSGCDIPVIIFSAYDVPGDIAERVTAALVKTRVSNRQLLDAVNAAMTRQQSSPLSSATESQDDRTET